MKFICIHNLQKKDGFYDQQSRIYYYRIEKTLEKMIILSKPRLNNLIAMVIRIITSQSVILSKIYQELKDCCSLGTEESKIKRLQRFLSNKAIDPEKLYEFFQTVDKVSAVFIFIQICNII